ncbi:MAG: hypothetical protein JNL98_17655 [Bryobacterales bacterium]|nr:hypothetical protein [Bryobacterales bacterium]
MPAVVLDTHTIVWYLSVDSRLSASAAAALDSATTAGEFSVPHASERRPSPKGTASTASREREPEKARGSIDRQVSLLSDMMPQCHCFAFSR